MRQAKCGDQFKKKGEALAKGKRLEQESARERAKGRQGLPGRADSSFAALQRKKKQDGSLARYCLIGPKACQLLIKRRTLPFFS